MKDASERDSLRRLTVRQLRAVARAEGVSLGYDGNTKENIIGAIITHRMHVRYMGETEKEAVRCGA